jgi:hypothetical protein
MRRCFAVLLALCGSVSIFAQGKVSFGNDLNTLIRFGQCGVPEALACQPIPTTGPSPVGVVFMVGLFAGTSSNNMTLQTSVLLNPIGNVTGQPGLIWPPVRVILNGLPAGALVYMQVQIWDATYAIPQAVPCGGYYGASEVFTMTPGGSLSYPSIVSGGGSTCPPVPWFVCPKACPPPSVTLSLVTNPPALPPGEYIGLTLNGGGGPFLIQSAPDLNPGTTWSTLTNLAVTQWSQQWVDPNTNALASAAGYYRVAPCPCSCYGAPYPGASTDIRVTGPQVSVQSQ